MNNDGQTNDSLQDSSVMDFYEPENEQDGDVGYFVVPGETGLLDGSRPGAPSRWRQGGSPAGFHKDAKLVAIIAAAMVVCTIAAVVFGVVLPKRGSQSGGQIAQNEAVQATSQDDETSKAEVVAEPEPEPERLAVTIPLKVPELGSEGSRVPLRVFGKQADGKDLDEWAFAYADGTGVQLPEGTYEVRVIETPISAKGEVYIIPAETITVSVGDKGAVSTTPEGATLKLSARSANDVSDDLIDLACSWIDKDSEKKDMADELADRARAWRDSQASNGGATYYEEW